VQKPERPTINLKPSPTKIKGAGAVYDAYIKAHPTMAAYKDVIWKAANTYGLDATYFAALLWYEGFAEAKRRGVDVAKITSPTGAGVGPGQINPIHVGEPVPWEPARQITREDILNAQFNIRWSAYYFAQGKAKYGTYEATYDNWYNSNRQGLGKKAFASVPRDYAPSATTFSPAETAANANEQRLAEQGYTDPWVILKKNGKFEITTDPAKAFKVGAPGLQHPLTRNEFTNAYYQYNDIAYQYTGKGVPVATIAGWLQKGYSPTVVANVLSKSSMFTQSPAWKSHAAGIIGTAQEMFGASWKLDTEFVRTAIMENWDEATLITKLRKRPEYEKGPVFQTHDAAFSRSFTNIYGKLPDPHWKKTVREKVREGWTQAQFEQYLRSLPSYRQSAEAHADALDLLDTLGLVSGQQATLTPTSNGELKAGLT
jgi:hypothetical protein